MPLLITPAVPFTTDSGLPLASVYAIIDEVTYARRGLSAKIINFQVGYYASEPDSAHSVQLFAPVLASLSGFSQQASPEQANSLPLFDFLEDLLKTKLEAALPTGTIYEKVA